MASLAQNALSRRMLQHFGLEQTAALDALQRAGLVSDNCIDFADIAHADARRINNEWETEKSKIVEANKP